MPCRPVNPQITSRGRHAQTGLLETGKRQVYFKEVNDFVETSIYERTDIFPGDVITGPAIVEQMDATTVIPPQVVCRTDQYGNLILDL